MDHSVAADTDYTYTVTATDAVGNTSGASNTVTIKSLRPVPPTDTTAPGVPTGVSATSGDNGIALAWNAL